jgi:hypothetical protein
VNGRADLVLGVDGGRAMVQEIIHQSIVSLHRSDVESVVRALRL